MGYTVSLRCALVVVLAIGVAATLGPAGSLAQFSDDQVGAGNATAANSFGGNSGGGSSDPGPNGPKAYNDANGNGVYDKQTESKYNANQLDNFDDPSANLVIPSDVGSVAPGGNGGISLRANSISSSVTLDGGNGDVVLEATNGEIDLGGQSVLSGANEVTIRATGDVDLSDASMSAQTGGVTVTTDGALNVDDASITVSGNDDVELRGQSISARDVTIEPSNGATTVAATLNGGGTLDARGAQMTGGNAGITLVSNGGMNLNDATLTSQNGQATANLTRPSATLSIDATNIDDKDGTLEYGPDGVTVVGTPNGGTGT